MTSVNGPSPVSPTTNGPTSPLCCPVLKPASARRRSTSSAQASMPSPRALTDGMATRADRSFLAAAKMSGEMRMVSPGRGGGHAASRMPLFLGGVVAEPLLGNGLDRTVLQHRFDGAVDLGLQ